MYALHIRDNPSPKYPVFKDGKPVKIFYNAEKAKAYAIEHKRLGQNVEW